MSAISVKAMTQIFTVKKNRTQSSQNDFDLSWDRKKKIQNESNDSVAFSAEFSHLSDYTS